MIYHIAFDKEWSKQVSTGQYAPIMYEREGFIHASYQYQLNGVYERYYKGQNGLILLHINESKLKAPLVEEKSTGGELYPHIFGKINVDAVVQVSAFPSP